MPLASIGFLVGVLLCQSLTELPVWEWGLLIIIVLPLLLRFPEYRFALCIFLGFLYSVLIAHSKLATQISPDLEGKDLVVNGIISSITSESAQLTRFWMKVNDLSELRDVAREFSGNLIRIKNKPKLIQLTWYNDAPDLIVGQRWQLKVRLKRPRGFSNPGGFDYEAWLYQNEIDATGYVRAGKTDNSINQMQGIDSSLRYQLQELRNRISTVISETLSQKAFAPLVSALVVGDRRSMTDSQWSTLTRTGTNHLMAISGLHIGLIAGLVFLFTRTVWRFMPRVSLRMPAPRVASLAAVVAAFIYAALAGFSLPTQRALIMVIVAMLAIWLQRPVAASHVLATALLVVLIYDPVAIMSGSFWLSFAAVAVILYTMTHRVTASSGPVRWWWKWGRVQWVIAIGLAPLLLFWFQQIPQLSPIANFIAVPVVSLLTVPLSLLGTIVIFLNLTVGEFILNLAHQTLEFLWPVLASLSELDSLIIKLPAPSGWTLIPALIGTAILLAPKGFPARWTGIIWCFPLFFQPTSEVPTGTYRFALLDVGQGLAAVVRTRDHVLLYDAGPRYSESFDAGGSVIVPYLMHTGIERIDVAILSHDDIDHTGGYPAIKDAITINEVLAGPGVSNTIAEAGSCVAGQSWEWDGVQFKILHPPSGYQSTEDNNNSCVVQISTENDKLLLTGDMESVIETQFVKYFASNDDNLRANVVVPHHGSLSSSSKGFVEALKPKVALIAAGYRNRYGLPKPEVVARYQEQGATVLNTSQAGAIRFLMTAEGMKELSLHRQETRHYWSGVTN